MSGKIESVLKEEHSMRPEPQQRIDANALKVWRMTGAITSIFYWIIPSIYMYLDRSFGLISSVTWVLFALALLITTLKIFVIPLIRWRRWRYEVTEHELDIQHGLLIIERTLVPMTRIQHVDTHQGPLLRYYKLSNVSVSTAAGGQIIPALSEEIADRVRDQIAELARVADEYV